MNIDLCRRTLFFRSLLLLMLCTKIALAAEKPNIVFIYTDDQAPWALGLSGHPHAFTPNMDRLFKEGAYLTAAMTTTPVCSPSRASLMTSRYGTELGITDWIHPQREPEIGLAPETFTWPEVLQTSGYRTGLVGKWHLGTKDHFHPTKTGFDYFMGFRSGGTTPKDPVLEKNGETKKFSGLTTDILTDHALSFLDRNQDNPFLLCVHYRAPHAKWMPVAPEDWAPYDGLDPKIPNPDYPKLDIKKVKRFTREYLASVSGVDRNLGRLLRTLDHLKLTQKTIVIFSSDHGYNMGHNGVWHKGNAHWILSDAPPGTKNVPRGQRPNMYDRSIRVPTAVRWPGRIAAGSIIPQTISNLDWFPTILAMAGVELPQDTPVRGHNFLPLLQGEKIPWDNNFYAQYSTHHQSRTHMRMYRTPQWKLVRDFLNPARDELFHLTTDPAETTNVLNTDSAEVRQVIKKLDAEIIKMLRQTKDPVLEIATARR